MEQLLNEILEIEHRAKEITEEAKSHLEDFDNALLSDAEELQKKLEERRKARLLIVRETEEKEASEKIAEINSAFEIKAAKIDSVCAERFDEFVDNVTKGVIGG